MHLYSFEAGLLVGAGVCGHALRLATLEQGEQDREWIAIAAMFWYGTAAMYCGQENSIGAWMAIVGPALGLTAVLLTRNRVDKFQVTLGVFQLLAAVEAVRILFTTHH